MGKLRIFKNVEFGSIRTLEINGEAYFVGKDVADILGYTNPSKALADYVDKEDKLNNKSLSSLEQHSSSWLINESGLYSLILFSKMPNARKFKLWVTNEILPNICKHEIYAVDDVLNNLDTLISSLTELKTEHERAKALTETVAVQNQQIMDMQPKVKYYDVVLNCKDLVAISVIAKDYGWSAKRLNQYLYNKGVQYKQNNKIWLLYQKYAQMGYTNTKTYSYSGDDGTVHTKVHTYWTQSGRLFIYRLLKSDGILPTIEREENYRD